MMKKIKTLEKGTAYLNIEYEVLKEIPEELLQKIKNKDPYIMNKLLVEGYVKIVNKDQLDGLDDIVFVDIIDDKERNEGIIWK